MIISRALWFSFIANLAFASALSACATKDESSAPAAAAQCYWLSNEGAGWVPRPDLAEAELCFEMDSCAGGVGLSGGGCYKWASGADAPAIAWIDLGSTPLSSADPAAAVASWASCYRQVGADWVLGYLREAQCFAADHCSGRLGLADGDGRPCFKWAMDPAAPALPWSATLTNPQPLGADIPPPHDIYEDEFEQTSDSCTENCDYPARLTAATPIYARPDPSSPRVAMLAAAECVLVGNSASLTAPRRGVVLETRGRLVAGDVIYQLHSLGEGYYSAWRRGEVMDVHHWDDAVVRWDALPRSVDPRVGYWHELTRANGQRGWAKGLQTSANGCTFARR